MRLDFHDVHPSVTTAPNSEEEFNKTFAGETAYGFTLPVDVPKDSLNLSPRASGSDSGEIWHADDSDAASFGKSSAASVNDFAMAADHAA